MKRKRKTVISRNILSYFLSFLMIISAGSSVITTKTTAMAANAHTQQEAVDWAKAQLGKSLDYDNMYGAQCVDLIKYYYDYFGVANYAKGNGSDYRSNALPPGWTRIYGNYQPGDVAVWKANHVAIITSIDNVGFNAVNQNYSSQPFCTENWFNLNVVACAIRPNFSGAAADANVSYSNLHTTFVDTWNAGLYGEINNPSRQTVSEVGVQIWDSAGTLVVNHREGCGLNNSLIKQELNVVGEALPSGLRSGETYTWKMFAIVNGRTYESGTGQFTIADDQKPAISDIKVTDISSEGYTVSCTVTDNYRVERVQFPTWTDVNGQDDIQQDWGSNPKAAGTKNGNTYTFRVTVTEHNNESGIYHTHIYAWDKAGNQAMDIVPDTKVPKKSTEPEPTEMPVSTPAPSLAPTPTPSMAVPSVAPGTAVPSTQQPAITPEPDNAESSNYINSYIMDLTDTTAILKATIPLQYMTEWGVYFGKNPSALQKYFGNTPNCNITNMTYSFNQGILPNTTYYYYFYYSTGTKTVASKLYSFSTKKSGSNSSQDFDSVITTSLSDSEANFKANIPLHCTNSWGYYFGTDSNNMQKYVIEDNINKNITWMVFGQKNLMPNTTYYFYIYYVAEGRTVVSQLYAITTNSRKNTTPVVTAPKKVFLYSPYSNKKKTMYVEWRTDSDADGYQIQYAANKQFKSAKNVTITSWSTGSKKISKLRSKKKYYVRVRAYKNSAQGKVYGSWSAVKSCKVK